MATILLLLFAALLDSLSTGSLAISLERYRRRSGELAPLYGLDYVDRVPDQFIVMFHPNHTHSKHFQTIGRNLTTYPGYEKFDFGYTMNLSDTGLRDDLVRQDPGVLFVESDQYGYLIDSVDASDPGFEYEEAEDHQEKRYIQKTVKSADYGLQMVAAGSKLPTPVSKGGNYDYVENAGQGVNVYVLDSGIRVTHVAFTGRAHNFGGLASDDKSPYCDDTMQDVYGHGTQYANRMQGM